MKALKILLVEDDAILGMMLREVLEGMGYEVCALATTEEEAVADAARFRPDLMIVDQHLREGSGDAAVERIIRTRAVGCVFITGAPVYPGRPGTTVLQKPFLAEDLVCAIEGIMRGGAPIPSAKFPRLPSGRTIGLC